MVVAAFAGLWLVERGFDSVEPPRPSAAEAFTGGPASHRGGPATRSPAELPPAGALSASEPVRIRIPSIRVDAPVMRLGLGPDHGLEAPPPGNTNVAGWYKDGTPPGVRGTAVMAGHVDDARGPAVFYALGALKKGSRIEVTRKDGSTAVFDVDAVEVYDNDAFPDAKVYGPATRPELRLITCGGSFTKASGYQANVVAFAHLTAAVPQSQPRPL
ncbi:class F sortase [Streptomyces xanthochromogenes]|uniref:class F sortase n=1 Tax=Streptomyces TaxID=1883 RepID=UPI001368C6F6|nr:class F sortase [Streptomyces sp. SID1034]MYV92648.1 class F sortase [Streptomyces sp. SID1034]